MKDFLKVVLPISLLMIFFAAVAALMIGIITPSNYQLTVSRWIFISMVAVSFITIGNALLGLKRYHADPRSNPLHPCVIQAVIGFDIALFGIFFFGFSHLFWK